MAMRNGRAAQAVCGSAPTVPVTAPYFWRAVFTTLLLCVIQLGFASCASTDRLPAVPLALASKTQPLDIPDARFYAVGDTDKLLAFAEKVYQRRSRAGLAAKPNNVLAISGGGDDGAFGGGLLIGWSERGDRPQFATVTGISTGELSAPFAFLGSWQAQHAPRWLGFSYCWRSTKACFRRLWDSPDSRLSSSIQLPNWKLRSRRRADKRFSHL